MFFDQNVRKYMAKFGGYAWVGAALAACSLAAGVANASTLQICNPGQACIYVSGIDPGTGSGVNPAFDITLNSGSVTDVELYVLVPHSTPPYSGFTASFNGDAPVGTQQHEFNTSTPGTLFDLFGITGAPGSYNISAFSSNDGGVSDFDVSLLDTGKSLTNSGDISVQFSNADFPAGTMFAAIGVDANNVFQAATPYTKQMEVTNVPETGSLGMLLLSGLGIFGAMLFRARFQS
jgi:hypothetical protein